MSGRAMSQMRKVIISFGLPCSFIFSLMALPFDGQLQTIANHMNLLSCV